MRAVIGRDMSSYVRKRFLSSQLDYDHLALDAWEVVIFGSRAAGVHRPASDLDILFVTPHKRRISAAGLDCVLLLPSEIENPFWLGSELASHVVQYGKWIKGSGEWRKRVHISDRAIAHKQQRLVSVTRNAAQRWSHLHSIFHMKYALTIRRELQRLGLLLDGRAVPPTPTLDSTWEAGQVSSARLIELAIGLRLQPSSAELISQVIRPLAFSNRSGE